MNCERCQRPKLTTYSFQEYLMIPINVVRILAALWQWPPWQKRQETND